MNISLKNKKALVGGSSRGIGKAILLKLPVGPLAGYQLFNP